MQYRRAAATTFEDIHADTRASCLQHNAQGCRGGLLTGRQRAEGNRPTATPLSSQLQASAGTIIELFRPKQHSGTGT